MRRASRFADDRVVLDGGLVDLEQVLGRGRSRAEQRERDAEREDEGLLMHAFTIWRRGRPEVKSVLY